MPDSTPQNVLTVGEKMVALARLLAAEHVRQEVAHLAGDASVFASLPIRHANPAVRVSVRRVRPRGAAVYRDAFEQPDQKEAA